jgi:hypothetical protein
MEVGVSTEKVLLKRKEVFSGRKRFRPGSGSCLSFITNSKKDYYKLFKKNFLKSLADSSLLVLRFRRCSGNLPVSG